MSTLLRSTGASMNLARSLARAVINGNIKHLWLYIVAPLMGAILSILVWKSMQTE